MKAQHQLYQIATTFLKGIGPKKATLLISRLPSIEAVFEESIESLHDFSKIPLSILLQMDRSSAIEFAKKQLDFVLKHDLKTHFFLDSDYPRRLKQCDDAPMLLYSKGDLKVNAPRVISVVGTRNSTEYGKELTRRLIHDLTPFDVQIVSGLAYGTDYNAHRFSVEAQIPTIGVLGHGLDRIYPSTHKTLAETMCNGNGGGLITEFPAFSIPDRINFPMRNRIVAGMSDALVIIESKTKGGSMITAQLAFDYNREVLAFPGSIGHENSSGCNYLIQKNMAHLITNSLDLTKYLGWERQNTITNNKTSEFLNLSSGELKILQTLSKYDKIHFDQLILDLKFTAQDLNSLLFNLEICGALKALPGRMYSL